MNGKTKTKRKNHQPPLQLLDNYAYEVYTPPTASAFGDEIGRRTVEILERLDFGDS